jgi:choline dehydrogenase-like flavoprotein
MSHDVVIVGSGAGGSAAAYQLVRSGMKVLLLEQGQVLPKDGSTLDVEKVVKQHLFVDDEPWIDLDGNTFVPQERSNLGGKTKWYGAALLRFSPDEFAADSARQYLPWPIGYHDLEPFYAEAEQLLGVRTFPIEPDLQRIVAGLRRRDPQWRKQALPVGLAPDIMNYPDEAKHFDAFASPRGLKSDAENRFLNPVKNMPNLRVITGKKIVGLLSSHGESTVVRGVVCDDGSEYEAKHVVLAAGALHSPRILQRYMEGTGLASTLPCFKTIGRNYKYHLLTAMLMLTWRTQRDVLRKSTVLLHEALPHSSVQPLGWLDGELLAPELPGIVPRWLANFIGRRAYGFFLQTEDGSHPDNRVTASSPSGLPRLDYDPSRIPAAYEEHRRFVRLLKRQLFRIGYIGLTKTIPITGTAHACGTLVAGCDPETSVVDGAGKVHGMENLYVVDGSVLPRSSKVNPALTIYAWGLRVASLLANQRRIDENQATRSDPIRA